MARRKKKSGARLPKISPALRDALVGIFFVFLGLLVFFSDSASAVGALAGPWFESLLGIHARALFSPIVVIIGFMLALKRLQWSMGILLGLLFFWIGSVSMLGFFGRAAIVPTFDFSGVFSGLVGTVPAFFLMFTVFAASFVLLFEISVFRLIDGFMRHTADSVRTTAERAMERAAAAREPVRESVKTSAKKSEKVDRVEGDSRREAQDSRMRDLEREIELLKQTKPKEPEPAKLVEKIPEKIPVTVKKSAEPAGLARLFAAAKPESESAKKLDESESEEPVDVNPHALPDFGKWEFPPTDILDQATERYEVDMNEVRKKSYEIERALLQFKIEVEMEGQKVGPTVIQYRLKPAEGIKLSRIEALKKDLTLALKAKSIRIQAPIPGLGLVGVEVPNDRRDTVRIREVLEHPAFREHKSNLALVVGKDINGDYVVGDLAKMPHLLIAGQTGSGKSVGMNGFLVSLLYKNSPSDLRLIMIDPKRVELGIYN
jgi:hypothetical protein